MVFPLQTFVGRRKAQGSLSFAGNYYPEADCTTKPLFPTHHGKKNKGDL